MAGYEGYGGYGAASTPQQAQQALAQAMLQNATSTAPVQSPLQGAAKLVQALRGRQMMDQVAGQQAGQQGAYVNAAGDTASQALGAGGSGAAPATGGVATGMTSRAAAPVGMSAPSDQSASPILSQAPDASLYPGPMSLPSQAQPAAPGGAQGPFPGSAPSSAGAAGNAYPSTPEGHSAFIRDRAAALGLDPRLPLAIAQAEGNNPQGWRTPNQASAVDRNPDGTPFSFGDFQLNVRNGLGTEARRNGIDPADPNQWQAADEYALETMARGGLAPWRGDAAVNAFQAQGGGWRAPMGGNGGAPSPALAFVGNGPQAPALGAISGAMGGQSAPPMGNSGSALLSPPSANQGGPAPSAGQGAPLANPPVMTPQGRGNPTPAPLAGGAQPGGNQPQSQQMQGAQGGSQFGGNQPPGLIGGAINGIASLLNGGSPSGQTAPQSAASNYPGAGNPMVDRIRQLAQISTSPYADPATREAASKMLETQMGMLTPQYQMVTRPDGSIEAINPRNPRMSVEAAGPMKQNQIIEGPIDPTTGLATKLLFNQNQGVLGVIRADGSLAPIGGQSGGVASGQSGASGAPQPPVGVDPKKWRETLAERDAAEITPSAADELKFTQGLTDRQSYKEYSQSLPTWNAFTNHIRDNSPAADKAVVDDFAKILNPGRSVTTGAFVLNLDAQSLPAELIAKIQKAWNGDGELGPDARAQMAAIAQEKMRQYQSAWNTDAAQGRRAAGRHKISSDAIPSFPDMSPLDLSAINTTKTMAGPQAQPQAQTQSVSPTPLPSGMPPNARRAPDGQFYVPDPNRPGKYLRVN